MFPCIRLNTSVDRTANFPVDRPCILKERPVTAPALEPGALQDSRASELAIPAGIIRRHNNPIRQNVDVKPDDD
eukprot:686811-Pyramimonas_sp.AAC.1